MSLLHSPAERQRRISEIAHRIWESEGRPTGQARRHWQMAEKLVQAEERQAALKKPADEKPSVPPKHNP
ncbi:DUF2934 domain-containing protein [Dyella mobilis]|uniref:DUF2934 domain-containing protein n=1 Tax=Dyella mobilis TaxID=1849582 RepID=A0ABS2KCM2_9GAMM|nr:DUF2934 domain-containing protein [Dyella mobilis]MBM7128849.1 DUF2934 domain-containing protein [Dyella mobilis]GLQ99180.1 hypothetical protein GCM10007863_36000 [Dyella mobilis]